MGAEQLRTYAPVFSPPPPSLGLQVAHACAGSEGSVMRPWMAPLLSGSCLLELAALEDLYGDTTAAGERLAAAGDALGLRLELTGVMGKRTVHQASLPYALRHLAAAGADSQKRQVVCPA